MEYIRLSEGNRAYFGDILRSFDEKTDYMAEDVSVVGVLDGETCVGVAVMEPLDGVAYLKNIYVVPEYRFQKCGSTLVELLVSDCIRKEIPALHMVKAGTAPDTATEYRELFLEMERIQTFFDKCGFLAAIETQEEDGRDYIIVSGVRVIGEEEE